MRAGSAVVSWKGREYGRDRQQAANRGGTRPREVGCCWETEENVKGQEREEEGSELGKGVRASCESATGRGQSGW